MKKSGMIRAAGLMVTMGLAGLFPTKALAAGANAALLVATNQLTLPTNGTVSVVVTSIRPGAAQSFNLFQYNTVTNYDAGRWTVTLPPGRTHGAVLSDSPARLIYLQYQMSGSMILWR